MRLTDKQRKWIDFYKQGHSKAEAARLAGYKSKTDVGFSAIGNENYKKLKDAVKDREDVLDGENIATMQEVNEFWTKTMRDKEESMTNRLKASEFRAKAAGGFVDTIDLKAKGGVIFIAGDDEIAD